MLALVLSGAANFGAMQVGALKALSGRMPTPEIIVGTSAGSLNAVILAADPTPRGLDQLAEAWREVKSADVGVPNLLTSVRRVLAKQESLISSDPLAAFLKRKLPPGVSTFGELSHLRGIRAYAAAVAVETGRLVAFGVRSDDTLIDGLMASTAVPPYYPPWEVDGKRYLDGGVISKLPVEMAVAMGATQIIALDVCYAMGRLEAARGILGVGGYSLSLMMETQATHEAERIRARGVPVEHIRLLVPEGVSFWDYLHPEALIELGAQIARDRLRESPLQVYSPIQLALRRLRARVGAYQPSRRLIPESYAVGE